MLSAWYGRIPGRDLQEGWPCGPRNLSLDSGRRKAAWRHQECHHYIHIQEQGQQDVKNPPETQCGFRPNRSTIDMVFIVRQVKEKCLEQNMDLYAVFIDLTEAFDIMNREAQWIVLSKRGWLDRFLNLIRPSYDDMTGQVLSSGEISEPFNISNGGNQKCVLAPVPFNLYFACVLSHAVRDLELGVYLQYRLDGSMFDLRRLRAKTKTVEKLNLEALFIDDCALITHKESNLKHIMNMFVEASSPFCLTISHGKTRYCSSLPQPPRPFLPQSRLRAHDWKQWTN